MDFHGRQRLKDGLQQVLAYRIHRQGYRSEGNGFQDALGMVQGRVCLLDQVHATNGNGELHEDRLQAMGDREHLHREGFEESLHHQPSRSGRLDRFLQDSEFHE